MVNDANARRLETRQKTFDKRLGQVCKVFTLKICENKLNHEQKEYLYRTFLEAKWFYNHIIGQEDKFNIDTKVDKVLVKLKDETFEERELSTLSSQIKQELLKRVITSIKMLSTKKKKGRGDEVGALKFKANIFSIPFRQYGNSHKIENNKLKLTKCNTPFKIKGLHQIVGYEYANGVLYRDSTGYYFKLTCFKAKEIKTLPKEIVGIDFGIKDNLVLSNGIKINAKFEIPRSVRQNNRRLSKKKKGSKNYLKQKNKLNKSYKKLTNKKKDAKNKIVSYFKNNYSHIGIQDENIKGWHAGLFGKQIQQSILGGIISELKKLPQTSMIDRWFPSTKTCLCCDTKNEIGLDERVYRCACGYVENRDIHSGNVILKESLRIKNKDVPNKVPIPMECRDFKSVELITSALESLKTSGVSIDYEAGRYNSLELC